MIRILAMLTCLAGGTAEAAEYREITLANGRVVHAEITAITAESIELKLRQGQMLIGHGDLKNMAPMTEVDFQALRPWRVVVLPFDTGDDSAGSASVLQPDAEAAVLLAQRILTSIDGVDAMTPDSLPGVAEPTRRALTLCGTDLQCAVRHGAEARVDVVVMGGISAVEEGRKLTLGAVFVDSPSARSREQFDYTGGLLDNREKMYTAQHTVLALVSPEMPMPIEDVVAKAEPAPPPPPSSPGMSPAMQLWMPVPGYTALVEKDYATFGTAMAVVGVGTFATVHTAGHATWSAPQMTAMSALTSYGLTVAVNHIFNSN